MTALPSGTVTLFFTDVEGSTRLLQELGRGYEAALADHHRIVRRSSTATVDARSTRRGRRSSPPSRVRATRSRRPWTCNGPRSTPVPGSDRRPHRPAADRRDGLRRSRRPPRRPHLRRRPRRASAPSQTARELIGEEFEVRDLGLHRLKDLSQPQRLYQLVVDGVAASARRCERWRVGRRTRPFSDAADRARERARGGHEPGAPGAGAAGHADRAAGSGKTRLALQAGAELIEQFADGVFVVGLVGVADTELVLPTVAQTLGVTESARSRSQTCCPSSCTTSRRCSCWTTSSTSRGGTVAGRPPRFGPRREAPRHQPGGAAAHGRARVPRAPAVAARPRSAPRSREPLGTSRWLCFSTVPGPFAPTEVSAENAAAIAEICVRLDGLPLADRACRGARPHLTPHAMLKRLGQAGHS